MESFEKFNRNRSSCGWSSFAAAGVLALVLAGCGGGGSSETAAVVPPPVVVPPPAAPLVAVPTGTAPVTLTSLTTDQVAALTPTVTVGNVAISSPPTVTFAISDGPTSNNGIIGFGVSTQAATATLPSLSYLRFSLAKLVPGTNGSPSKWVSYIVTTVPTYKSSTDKTVVPPAPRTPTGDREGALVDNKNGTYTYTFARDITKVKDIVAAATLTAPSVAADLGDLTYEPTLTHRLAIQVSGGGIANPVNAIYDFIPSTGKAVAATDFQREVVVKAVCNECHEKLTLHGSRNETQYCVVCHTDQLRYGSANVASTAGKFPALTETATVNATTGITSYSYTPRMLVADGVSIGDFPVMVHRIHNGGSLVKENYNLANVVFDNKGYSMLGNGQRMCIKCHDNTQAAQADNHMTKPSRLACGACHDGINWAAGTGSTLADKAAATAVGAVVATSGHVGGKQSDDAACALCHKAADIMVYHRTENVTKHNPAIDPGLQSFTYEIKSAAVNATTNDLSIVFKISASTAGADGVPGASTAVTFLPAAAGMANPLTGFTGGPSFLLAWAQSQDGITTPIDYNNAGRKQAQAISVSIASLLNTSQAANGSMSAKDADGYYTATILGSGANKFPVGAKLRAVALQGYFTQISPASGRHSISVVKAVTGDTVRRTVVAQDKCANCHEWFEGHGGNRVTNPQVCVVCHVPGMATSGRGISDAVMAAYRFSAADVAMLAEWKTLFGFDKTLPNAALKFPVTSNNMKDMIHGIHSGRDRVTPFVDARDRTPSAITLLDFRRMDFPGRLNNCETCHVAGTYSNVSASALPSVYESVDAAYAAAIAAGTATPAVAKTALNTANNDDTVTSPFAAACISCHDSVAAQSHVANNGGKIMVKRSVFQTAVATPGGGESCLTCHGTGKAEDVAVKHK